VIRILNSMIAVGLFDNPQTGNLSVNATSKEHNDLSRNLVETSSILVKNNGILPLDASKIRKIAVIGDAAHDSPIVAGGGSGYVIPPYVITSLQGIKMRVPNINVTYANSKSIANAVRLAREVDIAIVVVATTSSEGSDRSSLSLGNVQDSLITAVSAVQRNTVVVVNCPCAVLMPWLSSISAVLVTIMPGQEAGNALASLLFGDVNPSGKLPVTFPKSEDQTPVNTVSQYPGIFNEAAYNEQLLVGYRWYDARNVAPLFPFGHGLSYTTFSYSNATVTGSIKSTLRVSLDVRNTGSRSGNEVVQLYLGFPASTKEPPLQLKGFAKVNLDVNQVKKVSFVLGASSASIWSIETHDWKLVSGTYTIYIGSSSRDIRTTASFNA